jgi:DNA-binding beta-propeller fold protein YncE
MSGAMRWRRACAAGILGLVACLGLAGSAEAAPGDPYLDGCFAAAATGPCSANTKGSNPGAALLSPDGRFLYAPAAAGAGGAGVIVYRRDVNTGALSFASCITSTGNGGQCTTAASGAGFPWNASMDRNGQNLYIATQANIQVFSRNANTGALAFRQCHGGAGCTAVRGTSTIFSVIVSPDGTSAYARGTDSLIVFTRETDGDLVQKGGDAGCLTETAVATCKDVIGLASNGFQLAVSPDGEYLYVPIQSPGGVSTFERFSDGTLLQRNGADGGCITTDGSSSGVAGVCVDGNDAMGNGLAVTIDPDGKSVYLGASAGVFSFTRNRESGLLTAGNCVTETPVGGCADGRGVGNLSRHLRVTPDGSELIVSAAGSSSFFGPSSVAFLQRNTTTGALTQRAGQRGCIHTSGLGGACLTLPLGGSGNAVVSGNGLNVYLTSVQFGIVAVIDRDFAPICQSRSVIVRKNVAAAIPLICADANGDPITLQKLSNPAAGTLGEVSQATRSVFYNPFADFTGRDAFTYRGVARGIASPPATMSLTVAPPPDADGDGDPDATDCNDRNRRVRHGVREVRGNRFDDNCDGVRRAGRIGSPAHFWQSFSDHTDVVRLRVNKVPKRAKGRIRCLGSGCNFKSKTVKRKSKSIDFLKALSGSDRSFSPGQVVEIRVTAPFYVGMQTRWRIGSRAVPERTTRCVPVGKKAAKKRCANRF